MLQGNNWREFAEENFNQNVALLHFIEEGEDSFYVTRYYGNGCEVIGYDNIDIRNMRPRFMSRVWPLPDTKQILGVEFLRDLPTKNMIRIKGNGINFNVQFTLDPLEVEDDGRCYKLNEVDDRMRHRCQWPWHRDHFEEEFDCFYKPYPEIEVKERLAIPSDFLDIHPMHMYTRTLIRHNGNEQMMRVKMERHKEAPERTNHVNVLGRWRLFARANGFEYNKLIRFRYMHEVEDLDAENEADRRYPVFHLC
ncbi:zinc finger, CCHC-type containing protein [Tanacetum coccineum]